MQGWSESEGISHQTSILKIRKMLAQWKSKNKNVKVKTKKFKCSKPNIRLDLIPKNCGQKLFLQGMWGWN